MRKRGWTEAQIREALMTQGEPAQGRIHSATRYVHPATAKHIMVDDLTGEIFHVGGDDFGYDQH